MDTGAANAGVSGTTTTSQTGGTTTPSATGAPATNAGSPTFTPPPGQRLVSDSDWNSSQSFMKSARDAGFNDAALFGKYAPVLAGASKRGVDPSVLAQLLNDRTPEPKDDKPEYMTREHFTQELESARSMWKAEDDHNRAMTEYPTTLAAKLKEVLGDDDVLGPIVSDALHWRLQGERFKSRYADGHPLAGRGGVVTQDMIVKALADGKFGELKKTLKGRLLAQVGDAANSKTPATPAGNTGDAGKPSEKTHRDQTRDDKVGLMRDIIGRFRGSQATTLGA